MGRPTKLTPELQEKICAYLRSGAYAVEAGAACGVAETTYYRWLELGTSQEAEHEAFREFRESIRRAEAEGEIALVLRVSAAAQTDWRAALEMLARKHPDRWGRRRIEVSGPGGGPVLHAVANLSDEDLDAELAHHRALEDGAGAGVPGADGAPAAS